MPGLIALHKKRKMVHSRWHDHLRFVALIIIR